MNQPIEEPYLGETFPALEKTDPDLAAMRARLAREDAESFPDAKTSCLLTMAVLAALQTTGDMKRITEEALRAGATPVEIKETLYQCVPYIGFPRTEAALRPVNEALLAAGVSLPVESCAAVTEENRFSRGLAVQKSIFGDAIDKMHEATPACQRPIMQNYLSAFCFGDVYTRKGLDLKTRELLTFSIIAALGGCESQVRSHVQGNAAVGNSKENLIDALACTDGQGTGFLLVAPGCNLNFEETDHGVVLSVNPVVSGLGGKLRATAYPVYTDDTRQIEGSLVLYPLRAGTWPQALKPLFFDEPARHIEPQNPFLSVYDTYLLKYDVATGISQRLIYGSHSVYLNDISPDGKKLLCSTSKPNITKCPFSLSSLYEIDLATLQADTLVAWDAYVNGVKGYQEVSRKREEHISDQIREVAKYRRNLLVVVEVERANGIADRLR